MKLPSGAELKVTPSPFTVSKALFQAMLEELKSLKVDPNAEVDINIFKDIFCTGFSSKKIESCLNECMKKATYNGLKADSSDVWESEDARGDYMLACFEVARVNVAPFMKSLFAQFSLAKGKLDSFLASQSPKTT